MASRAVPSAPRTDREAPICLEARVDLVGFDNNFINFARTVTIRVYMSNGDTAEFVQTPTIGFPEQLELWAVELNQISADRGYGWNAFRSTTANSNTALPEATRQQLLAAGVSFNFVAVELCPDAVYPTRAEAIASDQPLNAPLPFGLFSSPRIQGPLREFRVCEYCEKGQIKSAWFIRDDADPDRPADHIGPFFRPALAEDIPPCTYPCGTLALLEDEGQECRDAFDEGCDDAFDPTDLTGYISGITRRTRFCEGQAPSVTYFAVDPADPTLLVTHDLVGEFRNCDGSPLPIEPSPQDRTVYVVRLDGNQAGAATAQPEGLGFAAGDVGNTFTIGGGSAFPQYISYAAIWLGDTEHNAVLEWNGVNYLAGIGSGDAGYTHSILPDLSESSLEERHDTEITITAQPGAFVEFRFKVEG